MENPYQSPQTNDAARPPGESEGTPSYTLYSARDVGWATFFGSVLAGAVVLAINYYRLGNAVATLVSLLLGMAGLVLSVAIGFLLPEEIPNLPVTLLFVAVMWGVAQSLQGELVAEHLRRGGQKASTWAAVGIGVGIGILLVILLVATLLMIDFVPDQL